MVKPLARPLTKKQLEKVDEEILDLEYDIDSAQRGKGGRGYGARHEDVDVLERKLARAEQRLARHDAAVKKKKKSSRRRRSSKRRRSRKRPLTEDEAEDLAEKMDDLDDRIHERGEWATAVLTAAQKQKLRQKLATMQRRLDA